ncbi:UNVERIFIED_CONTAM: Folate transporter 1, chloroplastic [Sesamum calycinum]|uniref:Folate transporter 1, chloroplastic n=1 Tax=Sesamum calycinum TaxID=2727403 RepID=A0AAW2J293_9LAMI
MHGSTDALLTTNHISAFILEGKRRSLKSLCGADYARNLYETRIGKLDAPDVKTLDPEIRQYSDLPSWIDNNTEQLRGNSILMLAREQLLLNILSKYAFSSMIEGKDEGMSTCELSGGARIHYISKIYLWRPWSLVEEFQTYLFVFMHAGNQWKLYEVAKRRNSIGVLEAGALKTTTQMMIKETRMSLQSDNGGLGLLRIREQLEPFSHTCRLGWWGRSWASAFMGFIENYSKAKQRYLRSREELSPGLHLASAAEAGGLYSFDYAMLGASSKLAAILLTYPCQVIRARLQQRPCIQGIPKYMDTWHVMKETAQFEGPRGFYKGITANMVKNAPAASITFIVYENVLIC